MGNQPLIQDWGIFGGYLFSNNVKAELNEIVMPHHNIDRESLSCSFFWRKGQCGVCACVKTMLTITYTKMILVFVFNMARKATVSTEMPSCSSNKFRKPNWLLILGLTHVGWSK